MPDLFLETKLLNKRNLWRLKWPARMKGNILGRREIAIFFHDKK
jgi:hypothetical protein